MTVQVGDPVYAGVKTLSLYSNTFHTDNLKMYEGDANTLFLVDLPTSLTYKNLRMGSLDLRGDLLTDRWKFSGTNTFLGVDVVGGGGLAGVGTQGTHHTYIGNQAGYSTTIGEGNTLLGYQAGKHLTVGDQNTAIGICALGGSHGNPMTVSYDTVVGGYALYDLVWGQANNSFGHISMGHSKYIHNSGGFGDDSLLFNDGVSNIAIGTYSQRGSLGAPVYTLLLLSDNAGVGDSLIKVSGDYTAIFTAGVVIGIVANGDAYESNVVTSSSFAAGKTTINLTNVLYTNYTTADYARVSTGSTGFGNCAVGVASLQQNTTGERNVAIGYRASYGNKSSRQNVSIGFQAAYTSSYSGDIKVINYGGDNIAIGTYALYGGASATPGDSNIAIGSSSLYAITSGRRNIGIGQGSGAGITTGSSNVCIGFWTGHTFITTSNSVCIGHYAGAYETVGQKLFIHGLDTGSGGSAEADGRTKSLIYGTFNAAPASQILTINGLLKLGTIIDSAAVVDEVSLSAFDIAAGHRALALSCEEAAVNAAAGLSDWYLPVRINGVTFKLLLHS